ncbi:MAG: ATP-binding protein [candidate division NC10 bacterium]
MTKRQSRKTRPRGARPATRERKSRARPAPAEQLVRLLRSMPLFEGVPKASLARIAGELRRRRLSKGATVFTQGDPAREFCLLTSGQLEVTVQGGDPESPPVGLIEAPSWFGELAILTRQPRTATVTALTESEVWTLSRRRFEAVFARHPEMGRNLVRTLCERIQRKDQDFLGQSSLAIENARLFRQIQDTARQLEEVSRHKSQFLAGMSHELRTPLNAIIGFSEVLLDPQMSNLAPEEQREFLGNILTSGKHLLRLINDVLDLSKVEAGKMELNPEAVSLADTVEGVLGTVKPLAMKKQVRVDSDLASGLPPAWADPPRLKQILYNLLSNAIKFTPAGGQVTVAAHQVTGVGSPVSGAGPESPTPNTQPPTPGLYLEISVTDTGIGIPEKDLERIFLEFEQVSDPTRPRQEGTGLGLALVKKLVRMHGGTVRVASTPGKGSTFTFTVPAADL